MNETSYLLVNITANLVINSSLINSTEDGKSRTLNNDVGFIVFCIFLGIILLVFCCSTMNTCCYNCCQCCDNCCILIYMCFIKLKNIIFRDHDNIITDIYTNQINDNEIDIEKNIKNINYNKIFNKLENKIYSDFDNNNNCSICIETLNENIVSLKCGHKFHFNCIKEWIYLNNNCPLCRTIIYN